MTSTPDITYGDPDDPVLPQIDFKLDLSKAALVVTDPQVDFLSPKGVSWPFFGASIQRNNTVENIGHLFRAAKAAGITVAISPHYYYPSDHKWTFGGPLEKTMHAIGMFDRKGSVTLDGFEQSGADFLEDYKPYILDGETCICSPHKIYGPESNDLVLQLRKASVSQVILAGMAASLCLEGHLRELIEQGFEVAVVRDATAGPSVPEGDGYAAAIVNFRFLAHALWTTDTTIKALRVKTAVRAGSVRLDTQRAEISGACQFLLCPELSTAAVGRRLHDERPVAAVGNSHALRVVQFL